MHCSSNCDHTATWQNLHLLKSKVKSWRLHSDHEFIVNTIFGYVWHFSDEQEVVCSVPISAPDTVAVVIFLQSFGTFAQPSWHHPIAQFQVSEPKQVQALGNIPERIQAESQASGDITRSWMSHDIPVIPLYLCVSLTIRAFFGRNQLPIVEGLLKR